MNCDETGKYNGFLKSWFAAQHCLQLGHTARSEFQREATFHSKVYTAQSFHHCCHLIAKPADSREEGGRAGRRGLGDRG